jgi:hypothetical protein
MVKKWIQKVVSKHPGKLHRELDVPEKKKIPLKKLERATHSRNSTIREEANLAEILKKVRH